MALRQRFFAKGPTAAARKSLALWQVGVQQMLSRGVSVVSVMLSQASDRVTSLSVGLQVRCSFPPPCCAAVLAFAMTLPNMWWRSLMVCWLEEEVSSKLHDKRALVLKTGCHADWVMPGAHVRFSRVLHHLSQWGAASWSAMSINTSQNTYEYDHLVRNTSLKLPTVRRASLESFHHG